jgi:site-specific recombinase XerD
MLGAGLTPGDVRAMTLDGITVDGGRKAGVPWKLALPGNGNAPARETPVAEWAGRQLALWMSIRTTQRIQGNLVFPSTLAGKPWSHTGCYECCKAVLAGAGMEGDSGGVFKLRHTFALRQLSKGKSEVEVARWLGLLDMSSMARYRRVMPRPVDIV